VRLPDRRRWSGAAMTQPHIAAQECSHAPCAVREPAGAGQCGTGRRSRPAASAPSAPRRTRVQGLSRARSAGPRFALAAPDGEHLAGVHTCAPSHERPPTHGADPLPLVRAACAPQPPIERNTARPAEQGSGPWVTQVMLWWWRSAGNSARLWLSPPTIGRRFESGTAPGSKYFVPDSAVPQRG
jgi:hypothetical protein